MKIEMSEGLYTQIMRELEYAMRARFDDCEEGDSTLLMLELEDSWNEAQPVEYCCMRMEMIGECEC